MPYDYTALQARQAAVIREFASPVRVTIGTAEYPCVESVVNGSAAAERWGRDNAYRRSLLLVLSDLTTIPAHRSTVTYRGSTYRIIETVRNDVSDTLLIHLADA